MVKTVRVVLAPVALVTLLASCAGSVDSCDPTKGGLFGGLGGLNSGCYQRKSDIRRDRFEDAQDKRLALERRASRRQQQKDALEARVATAEEELESLDASTAKLTAQLDTAKEKNLAGRAEFTRLQDEIKQLNAEIQRERLKFGQDGRKRARIADLKRRRDLLAQAITQLLVGS